MELNSHTKQQLSDLLADPTGVNETHIEFLSGLTKRYPFFQPLHLLLSRASREQENAAQCLAKASLYNGGNLSYRVMFDPENFKLTINDGIVNDKAAADAVQEEDIAQEKNEEQEIYEEISELDSRDFTPEQPEQTITEEEIFEEIAEINPQYFAVPVVPDTIDARESNIIDAESGGPAQSTVSKYDDDKLPYTFLWWLAKTRKEHEQIFQPYVSTKKTDHPRVGEELQQQYVEHIFHLQTPFNLTEEGGEAIAETPEKLKEKVLIDTFIRNEPQIKAPKAEQINTENKAKKSAEDNYDLVSETLAGIYIEQMLYHKAIDTYQKLSLKFPEKSRYFADLIQSLEKKI